MVALCALCTLHIRNHPLLEEARRLNAAGKMLAPVIDDAHIMDVSSLRKSRLLFEDFPKNHCLVPVAQPELMSRLDRTVHEDSLELWRNTVSPSARRTSDAEEPPPFVGPGRPGELDVN